MQAGLYVDSGGGNFTLVPNSTTTFLGNSGAQAQFLTGITVTVPSVAPGANGTFQVRAWSGGSSYETALVSKGASATFTTATGGAGVPPSLPTDLVGLTSFNVLPVPEPSTIAFGVIGGLALLLRRRK